MKAPKTVPAMILPGKPITSADVQLLTATSWIDEELCKRALLRRVDRTEGAELLGYDASSAEDYSGIVFPVFNLGETRAKTFTLRRDHPTYERNKKGDLVPKKKYLNPTGAGNPVYAVPGTPVEVLSDSTLPIVITEGAKKVLALERLSRFELPDTAEAPRFLAIGLMGVYNFNTTIGKEINDDGTKSPVKGFLPDLERFNLNGRRVTICYDSDAEHNFKIAAARVKLGHELQARGAEVYFSKIPQVGDDKLGIDDYIVKHGPAEALRVIDTAKAAPELKEDAKQAAAAAKITEAAEFFQTPDGKLFATVQMKGHPETVAVNSHRFKSWITHEFYKAHKVPLSGTKLQEVIQLCGARAEFEGETFDVHIRVAEHDDKIYIDLGDDTHNAVEIDAKGWRMTDNPPVKFRRPQSMGALPWPVSDGDLTQLRQFLNAEQDNVWIPMVSWLIGSFSPEGPYPLLLLQGPPGVAKSTQLTFLRSLVDPIKEKKKKGRSKTDRKVFPKDERDLVIAANSSWVMTYDNIGSLQAWQMDALCRIATGGALAVRALYKDDEEIVFEVCRPCILNGVTDIASQADLADRALTIDLQPLTRVVDEDSLYQSFFAARPKIFAAILDALSGALSCRKTVTLEKLPRMADFALWIAAAAEAGKLPFSKAEFIKTYEDQSRAAQAVLFEASTIGKALYEFVEYRKSWTGTSTELLAILNQRNPGESARAKAWPQAPSALGKRLQKEAHTFELNGIKIRTFRAPGANKTRMIELTFTGDGSEAAQAEEIFDAI